MGRLILLILLSSSLLGCGLLRPEPERIPVYTPVVCNNTPALIPLDMLPVNWVLGKDESGMYVLGLRGDQYSNLAINMESIAGYIETQKETIRYYERCINAHNKKGAE